MSILLGNLSVNDIEKRAGIVFPQELKDYMDLRWQKSANKIKNGKWHCFDIPFVLVCGDMDTAKEIYKYLSEYSSDFKEHLQISISG